MNTIKNCLLTHTTLTPIPKLLVSDRRAKQADDECSVRTVLHQNSHRGLTHVRCELREGMAILHGRVSTFYLKQLAQEIVKQVEGVEQVVNRVDVGQPKVG